MYPDDSLTLHTDLYQINMMQVYFDQGIHNKKAVFEVYFRQQPFNNGYAVFAGLERIVSYLEDLRFSDSDIAYFGVARLSWGILRLSPQFQVGVDRSFCPRRGFGFC